MEPLYKGHIVTLETVLYIEVVLNSEVIVQWSINLGTVQSIIRDRLTF